MSLQIETTVRTLESRRNSKRDAKKCKIVDYTNKKCENFEEMDKDDFYCVICMDFIAEPIITPCKHIFCFTCFEDAQMEKDECPICRQGLKYYGPEVDKKLQEYLQKNYTEEFEKRKQELLDEENWYSDMFCTNFILENDWEEVRNPTINRFGQSLKNRYTLCIRDINDADRANKILEKVELIYPEEYNNKKSVLKEENGWKLTDFTFEETVEIKVKLYFKAWTNVQPFDFEYDIHCAQEGNYVNFKISLDKEKWDSQEQTDKQCEKNSLKNQAIQALK